MEIHEIVQIWQDFIDNRDEELFINDKIQVNGVLFDISEDTVGMLIVAIYADLMTRMTKELQDRPEDSQEVFAAAFASAFTFGMHLATKLKE